jgi:hypothetical protein
MKLTGFVLFAIVLAPACAFAADGQILINQATVMALGGFPYTITQPGSYKLSGNLVVPVNKDGIDIVVANVTLDLNGFAIVGPGPVTCTPATCSSPSPFTTAGVNATSVGTHNVSVLNGAVTGFAWGLNLGSVGFKYVGANFLVEDIRASGNGNVGIEISSGIVRRSAFSYNFQGMSCDAGCLVTDNVFYSNVGVGAGIYGGGLFGSNSFAGNSNNVFTNGTAVSQGNNSCGFSAC